MARRSAAALRVVKERDEEQRPPSAAESRDGYADTGEVEAFAAELPEKFLHCREMNHNWRPFDVGPHKDGGYERTLRCVRCKTRKVQHLDRYGMLIGGTRYEYPEGYQAENLGRIVGEGRGALRLESIKRITKGS
jgi:hypothetical protein